MKKIAFLAFVFLFATYAFAQSNDAQKFILLYQNPQSDSLVSFCQSLFESGKTNAALTLLEKETSGKAIELKQNIDRFNNGESFSISSEFSSASNTFSAYSSRVRATKNKKLKKQILDSLNTVQATSIFEQVAKMNAVVEISIMLFNKKNGELAINETISKTAEVKELLVKSFAIDQAINACLISKNTKKLIELKIQKEEIQSTISKANEQFSREVLMAAATKKEAPKEVIVKQPESKSNMPVFALIGLGCIASLLGLLIIFISSKKNKRITGLEQKLTELERRSIHDVDVQSQSIRHHEIQLLDARKKIESLETKNSDLIKQYSKNFELLDTQITDYQLDLKTAFERVTRENSVQNMMELNNLLTRNGQKIRENIKLLRI
jgi:hypothetical protein